MRKKLYSSASVTLLAAGLVGGFTPFAFADQDTSGNGSVLGGNQINVPVDIEADLCGNALGVLGISGAQCSEIAKVLYAASDEGQASQSTSGNGSIAGGNQINVPVNVALDLCGNSVGIAGLAGADCSKVVEEIAESEENQQSTSGNGSIAGGNQINIPVNVALDVCGNAISVLGNSGADCDKIIEALQSAGGGEGGEQSTSGNGSIAGGNQISVPADVAADICGNAVSVLGLSAAECMEKISETRPEDPEQPGEREEEPPQNPREPERDPAPSPTPGGEQDEDTPGEDERAGGAPADERPGGALPVTGAALGGLVAAAVAALGGGAAAMYFARRKKAAAAVGDGES
ncbi:chaplin family protein [Marinitenerispora sediminis]|uniref:Chaplin n=1 Tax=Marinitenerispora sediminis TaxID=1931232 RepID=A0A368TBQ2_9ACTN|nr:chaplin family protein [Marinitenerispora sediminis]RCV53666.1 chaplin [Marinitenerispora sediminis]RCV57350.1 chaplin [Marinitenerispora sediminis]RCV62370.1 chaplin [Marinitenerispora sediminis]